MRRHHFSAAASAVLALLTATADVYAQTAWDGGGDGINYADNLNWATNTIPGNGNTNGASIGNGVTQTGIIYNTATSYTSTGTVKANSLLVGTGAGGVGSLTLSGSAGTLTFGGDGYNNAAWIGTSNSAGNATGTVTVSAGKLAITGASDASVNLGVHTGGSGTRNGTLIINGGTVEVGRRILMGANSTSATGLLTISSGTLDMKRTGSGTEGDLGMIRFGGGTNTVNLDGGTVILSGFYTGPTFPPTSATSSIFMNGTTLKANVAIADLFTGTTANANYQIKNGGLILDTNTFAVTINDALSNFAGHNGFLRKEGTGTLTLTAANLYTGATTVTNGTLQLGTAGERISNSSPLIVNGTSAIFNLGGFSETVAAVTLNDGTISNGTLTGTSYAVENGSISAILAGPGVALTKSTSGTVTLSGNNTYTGTTTVTNGTLQLGAADRISNSSALNVNGASAIFNLGGFSETVAAVTLNDGTISNGTLIGTSYAVENGSISANLAGGVVLTKSTGGTVTLSGNNSYSGVTNVNDGTLFVNGTHTGGAAYSVASGATLGGSGRLVNSAITGAGLVSPGNSPGILTALAADGALGTDYLFEMTVLNDPTWNLAAASLNDVLRLTDATAPLTSVLDGDNTVTVNFAIPLAVGDIIRGGFYTDRNSDFTSLVNGADWQYTFTGGSLPSGASIVMSVTQVSSANFAGGTINDGWITTFQVVPEPSSLAMLAFGMISLWLFKTKRRVR